MTVQYLISFFLALTLIFGIWHYTKRRPLVAVGLTIGIALSLFWAGRHFFLTLLLAGVGLAYWRSERFRSWTLTARELTTISWWYVAGLPEEIRWRRFPLKKVELRALRQIHAKYRSGVFGEKQIPTTALILLHPVDYEPIAELADEIQVELETELQKRSRGFRVLGAPAISIACDKTVRQGWPDIKVSFAAETTFDENMEMLEPMKLSAKPFFIRLDGEDAGEEILGETRLTFGREQMFADVVITNDRFISRSHALYDLDEKSHWVKDNSSTNGTYVNEIKIHGLHPLRHGDKLRLGRDVTFQFFADEGTTVVPLR